MSVSLLPLCSEVKNTGAPSLIWPTAKLEPGENMSEIHFPCPYWQSRYCLLSTFWLPKLSSSWFCETAWLKIFAVNSNVQVKSNRLSLTRGFTFYWLPCPFYFSNWLFLRLVLACWRNCVLIALFLTCPGFRDFCLFGFLQRSKSSTAFLRALSCWSLCVVVQGFVLEFAMARARTSASS